jgi:hypothetical protein
MTVTPSTGCAQPRSSGGLLHEGEAALDATTALLRREHAGRERVDPQRRQIGEPALGHGRTPARVLVDDLLHQSELGQYDGDLPLRRVEFDGGDDAVLGRAHDDVEGGAGREVHEHRPETAALGHRARGEQRALVLLQQAEVRHVGVRAEQAVAFEDGARRGDLLRAEGGQGGRDGRRRGRGGVGHSVSVRLCRAK